VPASPAASPSPAGGGAGPAASGPKPEVKGASATALEPVDRARQVGSTGFLTPIDLELELAEPIRTQDELNELVDGLLALEGVANVRSDGRHVSIRYDTGTVLPDRIRDRLQELGHPATSGAEVQNPGDAAD
jgi:hypothetical protein